MPTDKQPLNSSWVKQQALEFGFHLVGITTPDPPIHMDVYRAWIESGRQADMAYLSRPDAVRKRADPQELMADCRSIVVTGTFYSANLPESHSEFKIARYALGEDYHRILSDRLGQLHAAIEERLGHSVEHRRYTDTGPLLERELAQRAGLGWIGKNTCLIHPRRGSYLLLAELMLDLPLDPDPPFIPDQCGTCKRCIEACPTGCIHPDRTLDASRCISYLTIERKGMVPLELRHEVGEWLFGCDICQQVCPWNQRFAGQVTDPAFAPRPVLRNAGLSDFLRLDPGDWRRKLRNSALERPRRSGLVRNAAIVAGNHARESWIDDLAFVLKNDPDPIPRAHAAWGLKQIDHPRARSVIEDQLLKELDPEVRQALRDASSS